MNKEVSSDFLREVLSIGKERQFKADGRNYYVSGAGFDNVVLLREPEPETARTLKVSTLQALVDFINGMKADMGSRRYFIHIESHDSVSLVSQVVSEYRTRETLICAAPLVKPFIFDEWHDPAYMMLDLLSKFEETPDLAKIRQYVGNVVDETAIGSMDDGVTQTVTVKKGIVQKENVEIKLHNCLKPYISFPEIKPVEIDCIFRAHTGPRFMLTTVSNEKIFADTIKAIKHWFKYKIDTEKIPVIG